MIGRLEARGWVRRVPDMRDQRRKLLWVTPAGRPLHCICAARPRRVQERLMAPLSDAEAVQFKALLAEAGVQSGGSCRCPSSVAEKR